MRVEVNGEPMLRSLYVNDSGSLARLKNVDASFAYLEILTPNYSTYAMPLSEYDTRFAEVWRPASLQDIHNTVLAVRYPKNAAEHWSFDDESE